MKPEVFDAALLGSWEKLQHHEDWRDQVTPMGNTVLHVHTGIPAGVGHTNMEFIKKVLDEKVEEEMQSDLLWYENANGEIPLHLAARFGRVGAAWEFLQRAKAVNEEEVRRMLRKMNKSKDTALHEAVRGGCYRTVKLLVEADPSCPYEANDAKETPLYLAAESGLADNVTAILNTYPSSAWGNDHNGPCGRTVLHVLVRWKNSTPILHSILNKDKTLIRIQDDEGSTPLHHAAAENKTEHLQVLLRYENGTNNESAAYIRDNEGRTPLHVTAVHLSWDSMNVLMRHRPGCMEIVDNRGQNVLHYAAKWACIEKFKYCLDLKYDLLKLMNDKDLDGNTPLHLLAVNLPYVSCTCAPVVPRFIRKQVRYLNLFNNQNLNAVDIAASHNLKEEFLVRDTIDNAEWHPRRIANKSKLEGRKPARDESKKAVATYKEATQSWLVVAALVATVSFTAGFTVPGGFYQNPGPDIGTAVMTKKTAFKAFLVSDALAFAFSSFAMFLFFVGAPLTTARMLHAFLMRSAMLSSLLSIGAMMVAFVTGVYAVVPHSRGLHFVLFLVTAFFFCFYVPYTVIGLLRVALRWYKRRRCPDAPQSRCEEKRQTPNNIHT